MTETGFQMESHHGYWSAMQEGSAPRVWRPRKTAREAILKCCEWTGYLFIPAMQVRELRSGKVIWRRSDPEFKHHGDPDIPHPDEPERARRAWVEED